MIALTLLAAFAADSALFVRVNQLGYRPDAPKVAVVCALDGRRTTTFTVQDEAGRVVFGPRAPRQFGEWGPCRTTARLDFSAVRAPGHYRVVVDGASAAVRIARDVYAGAADTALSYLRQQRSGWNPVFRDSLHTHDGIVVDAPDSGKFVPVSGGWADASDYLQYVTTSATATYDLLAAHRDHPSAVADRFAADGTPGADGVDDALDEARHGLEWLVRMFPNDSSMYNQLADDRDHTYFDLPAHDSSDYGWGKGRERPVYPCIGRPQGLFKNKNRSTGMASTAGKYAAAFALGAITYARTDPAFAAELRHKALAAYALGRAHPGYCQTAPGHSPYFYEEESWADDMELGAAELLALTHDRAYARQALEYAAIDPVPGWQGADTAGHYQFYPFHDRGHWALWRAGDGAARAAAARDYRDGLARVVARADNAFRIGVPFIWCSNDLVVSFATQALLYRRMTGDSRYREYEQAAIDWLFGANPWGTSMVIGLPHDGRWARDPHSAVAKQLGVDKLLGGLLDGPVYRSIYANLRGIALHDADEYAAFNGGRVVYHDDVGDYSTNEPIMDGTASLVYLLSALAPAR